MKPFVYVLDSAEVPHAQDVQIETDILGDCASIELLHLSTEGQFVPYSSRAAAVIVWHQLHLGAETIKMMTKTQIIVRNGVGFENVDIEAAARQDIVVANVPDYGTEEVADHTITLALALSRRLRQCMDEVSRGNWRWQAAEGTRRIRGQVFGIIGCGRIGTAVALRARAFGWNVCFYDPYLPSGYEKAIGVLREDSLESLIMRSDVLSLHVPLTSDTLHLIDEHRIALMKPTAILVNTSRGGVCKHAAIEGALTHGRIAGAALDVLEDEPRGLDLLSRFEDCILTPHSAFYSRESILEMRTTSARIVRDALVSGKLCNVVNGISQRDGKITARTDSIPRAFGPIRQ